MSYAPKRRAYEIAAPSGTSTALLRAFRVVLDTIEYGVLFVDEDLRVRMHNRAFREIWKVPGDFLSKKPALCELMEYVREHGHVYNVADNDWDGYVQARLDAIRSGDTTPMESQRTDGTVIQHQCSALPDGGYILTYFDITAGTLAEQALRDSEQRLVDALESTSDGFALFDKDDRLAVCNSRYRELYPQLADVLVLGTPFETIVRAVAERNLVRDPRGRVEEWFQKRMAQHRNPTGPHLQPQTDGRWLQIDERKTHEGGTVIVFTDITEIKRHEQELAEANRMQGVVLNELHAVLDAADYGILFLDADLNVRLHNRAYREVWEMPETLFADNPTFHDLLNHSRQTGLFGVPDEHWEEFANSRIEAVKKGEFPQPELTLANGKVLQFQCIKLPDGGRMLTYFDITERKRAEEALRESEERFRNLIEGSIQGILIDQQRKPVFVNQSFADMLGYESPEEILAMDSMDPCVAPHERARLRAYSEARLKEDGIAPMHYEYDALRKDGSIVTFQNVARHISWEGQPASQSTVIDVTERRRVEQALRDSEERYALAMEAINEGVYDWNIATDEIYYSPRVQAAFALSPNELRTREDWFNRVHPDDRQTYKDAFVAHFKGETERFVCEYRFHAGDGTLRWARQHGLVLRDEHGRAYRMIGSTGDITALRKSEQELQEKTAILETTLESMDQGISMFDDELNVVMFNPRFLEILGFPSDRFQRGDNFKDFLRYNAEHGEYGEGDIEEQVRERVELAKRFEPHHFERTRPDGTVIEVRGKPLSSGGFLTTYTDVTERKRREQELAEKSAILEATLESMDQGISMVDVNLNVIAFNRKFLELLDFPLDIFKLGFHMEQAFRYNAERGEYGEGDIEEQVRERVELAKRFEPHHFERTRPDGTVIEIRGSPVSGGGFVTTYTDVTERKLSEQALQEQTDFIRLNQVITAAANEATSVEDALKVAIDEICAHTRWPVGHVYMFDGDSGELVPTGLWHLDDPQRFEAFRSVTDMTRFASGIGLPGRVLASGKPEWIEDVTRDANFPRAKLANEIGVRGAFAIPVLVGREVAAVLEVFSDQPAAPNQSLLDVIGQIGTQLGRVIERKRAEQQLRESEERFRAVAQSASDAIVSIDSCGSVVAWNRGAESMFGYTEDEMMGKSLKSIMPEEYRERHTDALERIAFGGEHRILGQTLELHGLRKDGDIFPVELSISTWTIGRGSFHTGIIRDITERKRAEQALRESEERYALATQAATEGIYEWDVVTNTLYLSERAKEIFAFEAVDDPTAKVWNSRVHPDDFSLYRQARIDHFRGRTDHFECEYRFHDMGGQYIWILERGIAVRNEAGRAIRMIGALSDITTRKSAEIELRQAKKQAEAATQTKSTFLANMSHELRTPLNAIIGFTRLVMRRCKDVLPAKQFENLEKIRTSADHLLSLINDILDLSKIEAGRVDIRLSTVTVESLVDTCLRTVEPLIQNETLQLIKQVEPDLPAIVVDQEKLKQILMNFLSNAVKFTEKGSIKVTASRQGHELVIVVADTGIGIPEHALQRVFDEFRQVDDSRTRQRGGTGLGLSISRHLARLMGGDVTVESTVGVGSTFSVSIPLRLPEQNTGRPVIPSRLS